MRYFQPARIPNLSAGAANLRRVCWLRGTLAFIVCFCLIASAQVFQISLPYLALAILMALYVLLISLTLWRLQKISTPVSSGEFFCHLLLDVIGHALLLYFTGGYTNPSVSLLLISISIGASVLPVALSVSLTSSAVLAYTLLLFWYQPIGIGMEHELTSKHQQMISLHLLGMWFTFVISALLINYFIVRIATALREQQAATAQQRERQLRDENILAVAIQAAGAAHELGTPLSTMAVLLDDMHNEYANSPVLSEDIALLRSQISECKKRLRQLVQESQHTGAEYITVTEFMERILDQWQLVRPNIVPDYQFPDWSITPMIRCDLTLYQALIALLDNAADASPNSVSLSLVTEQEQVIIRIDDLGAGIPETMVQQADTVFFRPDSSENGSSENGSSEKETGLGLGLLLSQASIERLGGQVRLYNRQPAGTRTEIHLPI